MLRDEIYKVWNTFEPDAGKSIDEILQLVYNDLKKKCLYRMNVYGDTQVDGVPVADKHKSLMCPDEWAQSNGVKVDD